MRKGESMKKFALEISLIIMLILGTSMTGLAQEASKRGIADLEKGWQNLDVPLLEKTVKIFEDLAKKNPKDHLLPYYGARAHFAIADCLDIKSSEEFDQSGKGDEHIDKALDLIEVSLGIKEDSVDTHILKFHAVRRKMLHVSFPGLMMYISTRKGAAERAKELDPNNPEVKLVDALQAVEGGWPPPPPEEGQAAFDALVKTNIKKAEAYYQIGIIWEKAKKTDKARKNYEKALETDSHHHWAKKKLKGLAEGKGA